MEDFAAYWRHLNQAELWPRGEEPNAELVPIATMPPRYAASALAKLIRWSRSYPASVHLNTADQTSREHITRTSALGRALAARAQGIDTAEEEPSHHRVSTTVVFSAVLNALVSHASLEMEEAIAAAREVTTAITDRWTVTETSR